MKSISLVVAISENNVIGYGGKIPWRIPEDLKRFKELTLNHSVIMGRKTYESLPEKFRPLPQRQNIILTSKEITDQGIYLARSIEEALVLSKTDPYIIGGEKVYKQFLPFANVLEITKVHRNYLGDTFFPKVDWMSWEKINEVNKDGYSFLTYHRKK